MSPYYYRGTSWSMSRTMEFRKGIVKGNTYNIYAGQFDDNDLYKHIPSGTSVEDLPWFEPEGNDIKPYIERRRGVTGGLTESLGTAAGFASGIQIVFYIEQSRISGRAARVIYDRDWMTDFEGALAHIAGPETTGEVHDTREGIVGLTSTTPSGDVLESWGVDELARQSTSLEEEREVIVQERQIDLSPCCDAIAILQLGRVTPNAQLEKLRTTGGRNIRNPPTPASELTEEEAQFTLHKEIRERSAIDPQLLITLNLSTRDISLVDTIPESAFSYAYTQDDGMMEYDEVEPFVLGGL
jgi:hypothetical protein